MKQLELLEQELNILQENISRLKAYRKSYEGKKWYPHNSRVVGEFRHRMISIKQRLTLVGKMTTREYLE